MRDEHTNDGAYICVEPEVGQELWRWALPEATDAQRRRRANHLAICDACRLREDIGRRIAAGAGSGRPRAEVAARPRLRRWARTLTWSTGTLLAATLVLFLVLPPEPGRRGDPTRADTPPRFLRPNAGEVVPATNLRLQWRPVTGASRYRVRLERVEGGALLWQGTTETTALRPPRDLRLPAGEVRAVLEPVPADLALPADTSVRFRVGGAGAVLRHRLVAAPAPVRWLLVVASLAGVAAAFTGWCARRSAAGTV